MPRKRTQKMYFGVEQEEAVVRYLESESEEEKNKIFEEYLKEPLITMVESIIRRYKLYRKNFEFSDIHTDTTSFLMTKIHKFDHTKNTKAYSYFGTICKNYLMGAIQKDTKERNRSIAYDDISSSIEQSPMFSYNIDEIPIDYREVILRFNMKMEEFMEENVLSVNEEKLGYALIEVFSNFEEIFQIGEGNKFNKNLILLALREMTSLTTKEIRSSMKKFKKLYGELMKSVLN